MFYIAELYDPLNEAVSLVIVPADSETSACRNASNHFDMPEEHVTITGYIENFDEPVIVMEIE